MAGKVNKVLHNLPGNRVRYNDLEPTADANDANCLMITATGLSMQIDILGSLGTCS